MSMRGRSLRLRSLFSAFHLLSKSLLVVMDGGERDSEPRHLLKHCLPQAER